MNTKHESSYGGERSRITFALLRHAVAPFDRRFESGANPELSSLGRRQAIAAGKALAGERPTHVVASTLTRARQTAELLQLPSDLRTDYMPWLAEIRYPLWVGWSESDVMAALQEARHRSVSERWSGYEPDGESTRAFISRVDGGFRNYLCDTHGLTANANIPVFKSSSQDRRFVVVVGHAGSLPGVIRVLLGIPATPWPWELMRLAHGSITRIDSIAMGDDQFAFGIRSLSEITHLPDGDVSW